MKTKSLFAVILLLLLLGAPAWATTYYVDRAHPLAKDTNPGTKDAPWLTIGHAEDQATNPGDVVYVRSGTYDERVLCQHSGSAGGGFINFVGYPGNAKPVMRGFSILSQSYIRIIGFEITHNSLVYQHGITPAGTCSHLEILDNYIHHVYYLGIRWYNQNNSYITVRGNEIYMTGSPAGVPGESKGADAIMMAGHGSHILIEYNQIHRAGDFINCDDPYTIVRNNYLYDFQNSYWPDGPGDENHCDMFQFTGTDPAYTAKYHVYESNFMGDNVESNSHILQMRTQEVAEDHIIFRGNVGYNHGSYAMMCGGVDYVYYYNNTLHDLNNLNPNSGTLRYKAEGSNFALNNYNFNNIYSDTGLGRAIVVDSGCTCTSSNNLGYLTGSHESLKSTENPLFINSTQHDFHLQAASPAIGLGKAITTVSSTSGAGTSFEVVDAGFFCDGFGMAEGDMIRIGISAQVRITHITANMITVDSSVIWNTGDGVYWRNQDMSPDSGAYEYGDMTLSGAVLSGTGASYTVTTTGDARFVIFYRDGIPYSTDYMAPFTATIGSGIVTAKAYALHAQTNPVIDALAGTSDNQILNLTTGWNWISFNVLPSDLSLNSVFFGILAQVEQVKTQTQSVIRSGGTWKGDLANMNGIGQYKMYKVKVSAACILTVTGTAIASATPIPLVSGWNWVAYLPTTAMSITTALNSINGQVLQIKSLTQSATYNGSTWSGTLTQLEPGQGYAIKMNGPGTLIYPGGQ